MKGWVLVAALVLQGAWTSAPAEGTEPYVAPQSQVEVEGATPWTSQEWNNDPDNFRFAIVSDRTGGHRPGIFETAVDKLNLLQPEFVMSVGDLVEGYSEDLAVIRGEWDEFDGFVAQLTMPFFHVAGNHDLSNPVMVEEWNRRFGRPYYHFVYKDVLFLCLDTEDPQRAHISSDQIAHVGQALAENPEARWTLVFLHQPLWLYDGDTGWGDIEAMISKRQHTVFAGHFHSYRRHDRNDTDYFVLATTGGGSSVRGPLYAEFDHVTWVTMTDQGPKVANLLLEGILDKEVRSAETAEFVDGVMYMPALTAQPVFTDRKHFRGGKALLHVTNYGDVPMEVTGYVRPSATLTASPAVVALTVPANAQQLVQLELSPSRRRLAVEDIEPLLIDWASTHDLNGTPIELDGTAQLTVHRQHDCVKGKAKQVDGDLGDWKRLPFVCDVPAAVDQAADNWGGPSDCSFRFGVEYDAEHLYIAVQVTDEALVVDTQRNPWDMDGVEVRVDVRPEPTRSTQRGQGENSEFVFVAMSPPVGDDEMVLWQSDLLEQQGVKAACSLTDAGYSGEISIPRAYMDEKQGAPWEALRLNIAVDDADGPEEERAQIWWQPDWRYENNSPGSGTFVRR